MSKTEQEEKKQMSPLLWVLILALLGISIVQFLWVWW